MLDSELYKNLGSLDNYYKRSSSSYSLKKGFKINDYPEFLIVRNMLQKYNLPTECFDYNLQNLTIKKIAKEYMIVAIGDYTPYNNTINLLEDDKKNVDSILIHELIHMASTDYKDKKTMGCIVIDEEELNDDELTKRINGKNTQDLVDEEVIIKKYGDSLNEGITDYFTSLSIPNYKVKYPIEYFFASYIDKLYGKEIFKEYFSGNPREFYKSFGDNEIIIKKFVTFLDEYSNIFYRLVSINDNDVLLFAIIHKASNYLCYCFIKSVLTFIKLFNSFKSNISIEMFLDDFERYLNNMNNRAIYIFNKIIESSNYLNKKNMFLKIKEKIKEEGMNLK